MVSALEFGLLGLSHLADGELRAALRGIRTLVSIAMYLTLDMGRLGPNDVAERETVVVFAWGLTRKAFPH